MKQIPPGVDPRKFLSHHRERGPKRFAYTYADLAVLFGMTEGAVRQAVSRGKFDPRSLSSLFHFWVHQHRDDDLVVMPTVLVPPTPEKPSLTTKQAHDTVGAASEVEAVPLGGEQGS